MHKMYLLVPGTLRNISSALFIYLIVLLKKNVRIILNTEFPGGESKKNLISYLNTFPSTVYLNFLKMQIIIFMQ